MAEKKVVINLATGLEDAERVMIAFLVGGAAVEQGRRVAMFLTKEAVRIGLAEYAHGTACDGCPPLQRLFQQYADGGVDADSVTHADQRGFDLVGHAVEHLEFDRGVGEIALSCLVFEYNTSP